MTKAKTITIEGKQVPLTKAGLPNRVHLSKEARVIYNKIIAENKKKKQEMLAGEMAKIINDLMK